MARLHLDADASLSSVRQSLEDHGHDVSDASAAWLSDDDLEAVLLKAAAHGRALFTFRVREIALLAKRHPGHAGVLVAAQHHWRPADLTAALGRALADPASADWPGRILWLDRWRAESPADPGTGTSDDAVS
jgi:hypothetical protein